MNKALFIYAIVSFIFLVTVYQNMKILQNRINYLEYIIGGLQYIEYYEQQEQLISTVGKYKELLK